MKKILLSTVLCATMMFAANSEYKYEVTPMIGGAITEGNLDLDRHYANAGISIGANLDESMFDQVELGFLRSLGDVDYKNGVNGNTDTSVTRLFTNVIKDYKINDTISLYALAGLGVEFFDNESDNNQNGVFGNYGFGLKYKINEMLSLKTDIRHLVSFDGGDNNLLYTVGLAIPFGKKATSAPVVKEEPKPEPIKEVAPIDSDGDGVADINDKCPDTPKGDIVDENGCSLKVNLNILFDFDSARIKNSYDSRIKKFADFMKAFPSVKGKIEAHTDSVGTEEYNQKLSERRAASVAKALEAYGVEKSRLKSIGYGETKPVDTNDTAEGRAQNRRVEGSIQR
ncbi:OmpA family protein [Halarcobacter ebronensis]|uniref:Flagellar motor protein MotB n=1 Tax=Halarcobacter ebronensis TaxID=1462615 RepID=A0A4Q1AN29_9BACT|nr:OmpA family protein [Halarcobacter ebronensis]QKF81176.1 outer membrane fibronectin-binding protein [Halarcobacter ebronensis]RXK03249.1 flagellar motor protein MotB [Halarcobacter ebronensis]